MNTDRESIADDIAASEAPAVERAKGFGDRSRTRDPRREGTRRLR